jgi:hypothetical protein
MADDGPKPDQAENALHSDAAQSSAPIADTAQTAPDTPAPASQQSQGQDTPQKDVVMADISLDQAAVRALGI